MRNIDRLVARAGKNNAMTYCPVSLDGEDYSFWIKPMTMAQIVESRKGPKGVEMSEIESSIKLFVMRALNENGSRQYSPADYDVLMRLPYDDLVALSGAMNNAVKAEEEEDEALDIKSGKDPVEAKASKPAE